MSEVTTIGVDLAKNVFQVHGVDASGMAVIRKQLRRRQVLPFFRKQPPCLIGVEACATSHHWARQLIELGHEVKLMPPHARFSPQWTFTSYPLPACPGALWVWLQAAVLAHDRDGLLWHRQLPSWPLSKSVR